MEKGLKYTIAIINLFANFESAYLKKFSKKFKLKIYNLKYVPLVVKLFRNTLKNMKKKY